jgi:hypothetical protein
MPTEIFEVDNPLAVAFACDADLSWGEVSEYPTTTRKVEGKGDISDFISSKPLIATLDGKVTAMTIDPAPPSPQKLANSKAALQELADKRQIVLVIGELFNGYLGITRVEIAKGVDDGYSYNAKITFQRIEQTTTGTAQVPASKLRSKVKRKGTGKKGGAAKGSKPDNRTLAAKLSDSLGKFL